MKFLLETFERVLEAIRVIFGEWKFCWVKNYFSGKFCIFFKVKTLKLHLLLCQILFPLYSFHQVSQLNQQWKCESCFKCWLQFENFRQNFSVGMITQPSLGGGRKSQNPREFYHIWAFSQKAKLIKSFHSQTNMRFALNSTTNQWAFSSIAARIRISIKLFGGFNAVELNSIYQPLRCASNKSREGAPANAWRCRLNWSLSRCLCTCQAHQ